MFYVYTYLHIVSHDLRVHSHAIQCMEHKVTELQQSVWHWVLVSILI